jgi:hypothetical protein
MSLRAVLWRSSPLASEEIASAEVHRLAMTTPLVAAGGRAMKRVTWMFALIFLVGCRRAPATELPKATTEKTALPPPTEVAIQILPYALPGGAEAEISGMAWYGDTLILLPQYPQRYAENLPQSSDGALFALPKEDLLSFLFSEQPPDAANISLIPLIAPNLSGQIAGFEGFEAIAFSAQHVFLTIEAKQSSGMMGYLISGTIADDLSQISLDSTSLVQIPPQAKLSNMTDEALFIAGNRVVTLYEANGAAVNPKPVAHQFDFLSQPLETIPFPNVEYRITDVTPPDGQGQFWAINYFYPGDSKLKPGDDLLAARFGEGATHARYTTVERLLEFQYRKDGITLTDTPPLQLELIDDQHSRNWEAIAPLDDLGFILATDKFPETILAFVAKR